MSTRASELYDAARGRHIYTDPYEGPPGTALCVDSEANGMRVTVHLSAADVQAIAEWWNRRVRLDPEKDLAP